MNNKTFIRELPSNIFAGFVVSLIALPLGLGLSIASGAPPISGVIAAIIGGIIVSIFGGSHVTITGPGNGLVVAVLSSITILGNGNMQEGYLYTLAAIICSGGLIVILAFLNLGKISNFFPSSAIQGMLAAIGIIILSKQFHIMLGDLNAQGSTINLLLSIPNAILNVFKQPELRPAAIAGVASLAIMEFYPKIRNKYVQLIPAPMWIVVLSISFSYFVETHPNLSNPISKEYFINLPENLLSNFPKPNFSKWASQDFILAVMSITLIASIESLLSIKAVDKLDPLKRQSNVNRDLKALGIATVISGFLGGLNVVSVIARSSVNVNNNGTNPSSNFFHAMFLLLFIFALKEPLQYIPFPALAAILVYTGYKLASPTILKKIFEIGFEQVIIFSITFFCTLFFGIILGITLGIICTFLVQISLIKSVSLFIDNIAHNNIETYYEDDGTMHITVHHFSSFVNFFRLKAILDKIKPDQKVIVDFLDTKFIDHTVLENLWDYEQMFDKNGGNFEVVGLDLHQTASEHPLASRMLNLIKPTAKRHNLTSRQKSIKEYVENKGWKFNPANDFHLYFLRYFKYFRLRAVDHLYNVSTDPTRKLKLFDVQYSEGAFILEEELHATMVYIKTLNKVPVFTLDKGSFYERMHNIGNFKEVRFKKTFRDFAERFTLRGNSLLELRRFFDKDLVLFFESNNFYHIESDGKGGILVMDKERHASVGEVKAMVDFSIRLEHLINKK